MKVTINNIGIVKYASTELKGITAIAGLNQTGKSTISKSLFAMLDAYYNLNSKILRQRQRSLVNLLQDFLVDMVSRPSGVKEIASFSRFQYASELASSLNKAIFSMKDAKALTKNTFLKLLTEKSKYKLQLSEGQLDSIYSSIRDILDRSDDDYSDFVVGNSIMQEFSHQINSFYSNTQACITLEMNNIMLDAKFTNNKLVDATHGIITKIAPIYIETENILDNCSNRRIFGPRNPNKLNMLLSRDFNEKEITYEEYHQRNEGIDAVNEILSNVITGHLKFNQEDGLVFVDEKSGVKIEFKNISSGMKLFIILQRLIDNGTLNSNSILIIDEPEVNLHPEWQLRCAEVLVLLQKELHIKILVNTHSPYFLRALEVYLSKYQIADRGKFYFMYIDDDSYACCKDVTDNTECIYKALYRPFEEL